MLKRLLHLKLYFRRLVGLRCCTSKQKTSSGTLAKASGSPAAVFSCSSVIPLPSNYNVSCSRFGCWLQAGATWKSYSIPIICSWHMVQQKDATVGSSCGVSEAWEHTVEEQQEWESPECLQSCLLSLLSFSCAAVQSEWEILGRILSFWLLCTSEIFPLWFKRQRPRCMCRTIALFVTVTDLLCGNSGVQQRNCCVLNKQFAQLFFGVGAIISYPVRHISFFETTWNRCKS